MSNGHAVAIEMNSTPTQGNQPQSQHQDSTDPYDTQITAGADEGGEREADVEAGEEDTMVVGARRRSLAQGYGVGSGDELGGSLSAERRLAKKEFWRRMMINGSLIALWYTFSIGITVVSMVRRRIGFELMKW
jgi:hypothetical protein